MPTPEKLAILEKKALILAYLVPGSVPDFIRDNLEANKFGSEILEVIDEVRRTVEIAQSFLCGFVD